jgi:nuclear GTP-binding protein
LEKFYGITGWKDCDEFLDKLARKKGKLIKGGEADLKSTAKLVLMDWQVIF